MRAFGQGKTFLCFQGRSGVPQLRTLTLTGIHLVSRLAERLLAAKAKTGAA